MHEYPPFAQPISGSRKTGKARIAADELPLIDAYLDELPPIEDFLSSDVETDQGYALADGAQTIDDADAVPLKNPTATGHAAEMSEGWARDVWQSYDWSSLASLGSGKTLRVDEDTVWGEADWPLAGEAERGRASVSPSAPGAEEIASALDALARRIRSGELSIDNLRGAPAEAAMAAALAALLRMRG